MKGPPGAGAAAFETAHHVPEMPPFGQRGFHTDDEMEMVGHYAKLPNFNHRIILGNLLLLYIADCLAQSRKFHLWASAVPHSRPNKGSRPSTTSVSI